MNITKLKLSKLVSSEVGTSIEDSKIFVNKFFKIKKFFLKSRNLKISKFGSFKKNTSPERIGRNPKTLEEYVIPKKSKISFKASKKIKHLIN